MRYSVNERTFYVYDVIGNTQDGFYGADIFAQRLEKMTGRGDITLRINSPGGSVFELWTIIELLRDKKKKTGCRFICIVDGMAASAASVLLTFGDIRLGSKQSVVMIHKPASFCYGDDAEMRATADLLTMLGMELNEFYRDQLGIPLTQVETWMNSGDVYFDADESLLWGFIQQITNSGETSYTDSDYGKQAAKKMAAYKVSACQSKMQEIAREKGRQGATAKAYRGGVKHSIFPAKFRNLYPKKYQDWFTNILPPEDQQRVLRHMERQVEMNRERFQKTAATSKSPELRKLAQQQLTRLQ